VRRGLIAKPDHCQNCGSTRAIHGHHHLGYAKENRLKVQWLCALCHKAAHAATL
jgi:hypothetical protein